MAKTSFDFWLKQDMAFLNKKVLLLLKIRSVLFVPPENLVGSLNVCSCIPCASLQKARRSF